MKAGDQARVMALPFHGRIGTVVEIDGAVTWLRLDDGLTIGFLAQSIAAVNS